MRYLLLTIVLIAGLLATAGCTESRTVAPGNATAPDILIEYHRTGGLAGVDDHLVIFDTGDATLLTRSKSASFRLKGTELENLDTLFAKASFPNLSVNYTARFSGYDYYTYVITYRGKTVTTRDTVIPRDLQPAITELNAIVARYRDS
ncbi:MAG: hypothetical protein ABFC24_05870 [Methanoregulaceae archaeon]